MFGMQARLYGGRCCHKRNLCHAHRTPAPERFVEFQYNRQRSPTPPASLPHPRCDHRVLCVFHARKNHRHRWPAARLGGRRAVLRQGHRRQADVPLSGGRRHGHHPAHAAGRAAVHGDGMVAVAPCGAPGCAGPLAHRRLGAHRLLPLQLSRLPRAAVHHGRAGAADPVSDAVVRAVDHVNGIQAAHYRLAMDVAGAGLCRHRAGVRA